MPSSSRRSSSLNTTSMAALSPIPLEPAGAIERQLGAISKEFGDRLKTFLVQRHRRCPAKFVHAGTGISPKTVDKWLHRHSVPNGPLFLQLIRTYGAELLMAVDPAPPDWVKIAAQLQRNARIEAEIAKLEAQKEKG